VTPAGADGHDGPAAVGRELRARYAFAGAAEELSRTAPLVAGEEVLLHGVMRLRRLGRLPRPVVLRLTTGRLSLVAHYSLQPDRVWDLPRAAVRDVRLLRGAVHVSWTSDGAGGSTVVRLTGWTGRPAMDRPLYDAGSVTDVLVSWLSSAGGSLPVRRPHSHRPR
jgi:hypothetical protein